MKIEGKTRGIHSLPKISLADELLVNVRKLRGQGLENREISEILDVPIGRVENIVCRNRLTKGRPDYSAEMVDMSFDEKVLFLRTKKLSLDSISLELSSSIEIIKRVYRSSEEYLAKGLPEKQKKTYPKKLISKEERRKKEKLIRAVGTKLV